MKLARTAQFARDFALRRIGTHDILNRTSFCEGALTDCYDLS